MVISPRLSPRLGDESEVVTKGERKSCSKVGTRQTKVRIRERYNGTDGEIFCFVSGRKYVELVLENLPRSPQRKRREGPLTELEVRVSYRYFVSVITSNTPCVYGV